MCFPLCTTMNNFKLISLILLLSVCFRIHAQKSSFNYKTDYHAYLKRSKDSTSRFYYAKLKSRLDKVDTTLSANDLLYLLIYTTASSHYNPVLLDTLCQHLYDFNEKGEYFKALALADSILRVVPINLTAIKEKGLALKKLNKKEDFERYWALTRKTAEALFLSGDGYYKHPFLGVNYFDGITFYGTFYQCYPSKSGFMLDKQGRLLAAFYGYSQKMDNIIINYFQLDHAKRFYKPNIVEGEE